MYVSGPYRGDVEANVKRAEEIGAALMAMGHSVIIPHKNTYRLDEYLPDGFDFLAMDFQQIERVDALVIVPGWGCSEGTRREIALAEEIGLPVYYWPEHPPFHPTEVRCPEQVKGFIRIIMRMYRTHLDKNADYSPANIMATGEIGLATRLWDKTARLLNLIGFRFDVAYQGYDAPKQPKNESIGDNLLDAAVYPIIWMLFRLGKWGR